MKHSKRRQQKQQEQDVQIQGIASPPKQEDQGLTLDEALELFLQGQQAMNREEKTLRNYAWVINSFLKYIRETHQYHFIKQVSEADILVWLAHLNTALNEWGRPYKSGSIVTYTRNVTVFFNWLVRHKHIPCSPMAALDRPKEDKVLIRVFSEDELLRMDAACDRLPKGQSLTEDERKALAARDRAFLWLLLSTGVRVSEACGLKFSDIDWKEGMIYVHGKGAKERHIPFGKVAQQHLDTYVRYWRGEPLTGIRPDDYVFLTAFGNPLRYQAAFNMFVRLKQVAGITDKRVSPHTCRHWFAVNAIKNGMPTIVLKNILGHENWDMIEVYVRLADQDVKRSYSQFSPVDALDMHRYPKGKRTELRNWRNARRQGKGN